MKKNYLKKITKSEFLDFEGYEELLEDDDLKVAA